MLHSIQLLTQGHMKCVCVTLETGGGGFSEWEENVAHDSGASDARGGDDVEDAIHVLPQVLLKTEQT